MNMHLSDYFILFYFIYFFVEEKMSLSSFLSSYHFIDNAGFIKRDAGVSLTRVSFSRYQRACDSNHGNSLVGLSPRRHVMCLRV
jgi:hypothetical protein